MRIKESLYRFDTNDFVSLNIWLNRHLPLKNYAIENCNIQLYNSDDRIFVRGSPSLVRVRKISMNKSFCLDAAHSISSRSTEVLYNLVARNSQTQKGYPTIQSMANIFEVTRCVNPETITIDYYVAELNTIRNVLEGVYVHCCGFHVLKVWRKALHRKIKLSDAHTQEEVDTYEKQLEGLITQLLHEKMVNQILWTTSKTDGRKLRSWKADGVKHTCLRHIEICSLTITSKYLTFVSVNDAEFYFAEERECILFNNGRMGLEQNEQAKRSFFASEVSTDQLPSLI
ncbi:hypothetical protein CU098_008132 [Rhizopus stolonifer]|uniref:MULE transposase domain-containing protein n=1 Tax=Rhizopus stolonifer TaxID=4846 RepID=A0A367JDP1_RHIST|nr:hypothetical protein CU098_008132 [Rhizopus stolonifer]